MEDLSYTKIQEKKIEHMKSFSRDGSLPFLAIETWGAHEAGSGYEYFYVYDNGKFVKEESQSFFKSIPGDDETRIRRTENHLTTFEGNLSEEKLTQLKVYIDKNVVESKSNMVFDAGVSVTYFKDGKAIRVENDNDLFENVKSLLPFDL